MNKNKYIAFTLSTGLLFSTAAFAGDTLNNASPYRYEKSAYQIRKEMRQNSNPTDYIDRLSKKRSSAEAVSKSNTPASSASGEFIIPASAEEIKEQAAKIKTKAAIKSTKKVKEELPATTTGQASQDKVKSFVMAKNVLRAPKGYILEDSIDEQVSEHIGNQPGYVDINKARQEAKSKTKTVSAPEFEKPAAAYSVPQYTPPANTQPAPVATQKAAPVYQYVVPKQIETTKQSDMPWKNIDLSTDSVKKFGYVPPAPPPMPKAFRTESDLSIEYKDSVASPVAPVAASVPAPVAAVAPIANLPVQQMPKGLKSFNAPLIPKANYESKAVTKSQSQNQDINKQLQMIQEQLSAIQKQQAGKTANTAQPAPVVTQEPSNQVSPPVQPKQSQSAGALPQDTIDILAKIPRSLQDSIVEKNIKINKPSENSNISKLKSNKDLGINIEISKSKFDINGKLNEAYKAMQAGNVAVASAIYNDILSIEPVNRDALFALALIGQQSGRYDMAKVYYGRLINAYPGDIAAISNFLTLVAEESPVASLKQLEVIEANNPRLAFIPAIMSQVYASQGDMQNAIRKLIRALSLEPDNVSYKYNLAVMFDSVGSYKNAISFYKDTVNNYSANEIPASIEQIYERLTFLSNNPS